MDKIVAAELLRLRRELDRLRGQVPVRLAIPAGSTFSSGMFQIIGGNSLAYLPGSVGITKVNTLISVIPAGYSNGSPSTLIDGVGWARSMDDDSFCLVVNDSLGLLSHDILMGTPVFAVQRATIDDDAGGTYRVYRVTGTI